MKLTIELDCPACENLVPLTHEDKTVECPNCHAQLSVDVDAELVGDEWKDLTKLRRVVQ